MRRDDSQARLSNEVTNMLVLKTDPAIRGAKNKTLFHNNRQASNKLAQTPN